ncbi:MAG: hypothetical protein JXA69_16850, partial [Phycisphaerae bacterium]|nr:hypothetical protein [Phycisphaerae bacterium]
IDPGNARWFAREKFTADDMTVMRQGITDTLRRYAGRDYQYDAMMAFHAFDNWGSGASRKLPDAARQWNEAGEGPKIVIATPDAFFEHILADSSVTLPIYRGGFGGAWDRLKVATPATWQRMQAAEAAYRQANLTAADARVIALLTLYGHTFPLGAGWPGILTEDQTLRHNREQGEFVAALRVEGRPWPVRGEPAPLPAAGTGMPAANTLYRAKGVSIWQAVGDNLEPVEPGAWTALPPRRTADDTWQLRHRIDRKALGTERTSIVWAWPIQTPAEQLRPRVRTATGWMQIPDELLDQQFHNGWLSPRATQFDGVEVAADVPLAFCVSPKAYPNWVFAQCLGQGFKATFNGGAQRTLTFEETYPYEPPIAEFTIEVRPLNPDGD